MAADFDDQRDVSFTSMQNARIVGSGCLLSRFQRKTWEARQHAPESVLHEAVKVASCSRNMEISYLWNVY